MQKSCWSSSIAVVLVLMLSMILSSYAGAETASITVDVNSDLGSVNRSVLSSAMARSTNWEGLWDFNNNSPTTNMVEYAKGIGLKYLRYSALNEINWKTDAVGPNRSSEVGLSEYLKICKAYGAVPVIVIPDKRGTSSDAADLVEYLNAPNNGSNPNGGTDWALVRAEDGHPEPWNVIWFEYGNESWAQMQANEYVNKYLEYRNAVRQTMISAYPDLAKQELDERIKLGAVLGNYFWDNPRGKWNSEVIPGTGSIADFFIIHTYIPHYQKTCCNVGDNLCLTTSLYADGEWFYPELCTSSAEYVFQTGLSGVSDQLENYLLQLNEFIKEMTGRNVGIAITEFNGLFVQNWNLLSAYRHSLGDALINAEFLRQFMHADNIIMSNFWQFANDYWGMVVGPNSYQNEINKPFGVRPNYYPFYFYHNYFGDTLIDVDMDVPAYYEDGFYENINGNIIYDNSFGVKPAYADAIQYENIDNNNLLDNLSWSASQLCDPVNPDIYPVCEQKDSEVLTVKFNGTQNVDYDDSQIMVGVLGNTRYRLSGLIKTNNLGDGEEAYLAVQTDGINLLADGGFENTDTGWPSDPNADWSFQPNADSVGLSTSVSSATSYSGMKSAYISFGGNYDNNFYHVASAPIAVQSNMTYTLEGYIKTDKINYGSQGESSSNEWYGIMLAVADVNGCTYGSSYTCWALPTGIRDTHDWTRVSKTFRTSSYTNQLKVQLRRMSGGGNIGGEAWWDHLKLSGKITTEPVSGTSDWRYVYVDFYTGSLNNPSSIAIVAGGNVRGGGAQDKYIQLKNVKLQKFITNSRNGATPYLSVNASKSTDGKKVYLMVVNKDMANDITTTIKTAGFSPKTARAWVLNGPVVYSTNESNPNNIHVDETSINVTANPFSFTFPAHSLTALVVYTDTDNDGDGTIDEGVLRTYYLDADGDGYGNQAVTTQACTAPAGYITEHTDCNDSNATAYPGAPEIPNDGIDQDCNGEDLDNLPPDITITTPTDGSVYLLNQEVVANWVVTDSGSGVASSTGTASPASLISTSIVGNHGFTVSASDNAGNSASQSVTYSVNYSSPNPDFFLPPLENNRVYKLNSTIPVKFQLKDAAGNYVSTATAYLTLLQYSDNEPIGNPIDVTPTDNPDMGNLFRYDSAGNQYIYNLKTTDWNLSIGTWQIKVGLNDGTIKTIFIGLK